MTDRRRTLLFALLALVLVQCAHLLDVFRYSDDPKVSSLLFERQGQLGIVAAVVAFIAVLRRDRFARELAVAAGAIVAVGFALYHGIPIDLGVNNPYWGRDGDADLIRWLTVLAAIAVGIWTARVALGTRVHAGEARQP